MESYHQIYLLFEQEVNQAQTNLNLAKASLYIAQLNEPELDIEADLNALDTMALEVKERLPKASYPLKIIQTINQYLFDDLGFRGNTEDYCRSPGFSHGWDWDAWSFFDSSRI